MLVPRSVPSPARWLGAALAALALSACGASSTPPPQPTSQPREAKAPDPAALEQAVDQALLAPSEGRTPASRWDEQTARGPGWLGVELAATEPKAPGVQVRLVVPRSPAAAAGLQSGDVLLQVDGMVVNEPADVVRLVQAKRAGSRVNLMLKRGDAQRMLAAELGSIPSDDDVLRMSYVGTRAPAFRGVKTVQGSVPPTVGALRGKVVVVEFWAPWCAVCRVMVPTMNDWHARWQKQGVEVIGITTDAVGSAARAAAQLGMQYPVASDESGETTRAYRATALPTLFVIDQDGTVRDVMVGYSAARLAEVEQLVSRLVADAG